MSSIIKIISAILAFLLLILTIKYMPIIIEITFSLDKFREYIISSGNLGVLLIIFFQMLQTIIAPIPGEVIQIATGYIYGSGLGLIYITSGLLLGSMVVFYFTRFIGANFVKKLIKRKNMNWVEELTDSTKFSIILFIFFAIPGLPKDFLIYIAGLTAIKASKFFTILIVARLPWLLASVCIGSTMNNENYTVSIIIALVAVILFAIGLFYKDKIINKVSLKIVNTNENIESK